MTVTASRSYGGYSYKNRLAGRLSMSFLLPQLIRNRALLDRMQIEHREETGVLIEKFSRAQSTVRVLQHRMRELEREVIRLRSESLARKIDSVNSSERESLMARIRELEASLVTKPSGKSKSISGDEDGWCDLKK